MNDDVISASSQRPDAWYERISVAALLCLVTLVGAVLRLAALEHQSFWYDECVSAALAKAPWIDILAGRAHDLGTPPLHLLLLRSWSALFGDSDAALRGLSAGFGIGAIPLLYRIGRCLFSERVGLWASAILAISPFHVYYSQEARPYALAMFLVLASTDALLAAVAAPAKKWLWVAYSAFTFFSIYSHYYCFFVVMAHLIFILARHRAPRMLPRSFILALSGAALFYLTWLPSFWAQVTTKGNLGRAAETWFLHFVSTPLVFSVGTTLIWKDSVSLVLLILACIAVFSFCLPAVVAVVRLLRDRGELALLLPWLLCPILVPLLVSVTLFPFYYVRYSLVASPAFYLLIAAGLDRMRRPVAGILAIGMVVTGGTSLVCYFTKLVKHDWRAATSFLEAQLEPGDVVAFDADLGATPFSHYADREGRDCGSDGRVLLLPPEDPARHAFWGTSSRHEPAHDVGRQLTAARRIWFVYSDPKCGSGDYYKSLFAAHWSTGKSRHVRGIDLTVYTPTMP